MPSTWGFTTFRACRWVTALLSGKLLSVLYSVTMNLNIQQFVFTISPFSSSFSSSSLLFYVAYSLLFSYSLFSFFFSFPLLYLVLLYEHSSAATMIVPTAAENRDTGSNQLNTDMDLPRLDKSGSHWTQEHLDSLHVHLRADVPLGLFSFLFSFFFFQTKRWISPSYVGP